MSRAGATVPEETRDVCADVWQRGLLTSRDSAGGDLIMSRVSVLVCQRCVSKERENMRETCPTRGELTFCPSTPTVILVTSLMT